MSDKKLLIKSVITGTLCGLLVSIIFMSICAVVLLKGGLPQGDLLDYVLAGFLAAGAFAGGFIAAKLNKGAGLIVGAITGAVMIFLIALVSACKGDVTFSALFFIKLAAAVIGGILGGILAVREKKHISI